MEFYKTLTSGEDAISYFAKYGNSTPIKFIHCIRAEMPPDKFRPYDLAVLPNYDKEISLPEYYTISAHGIVHVVT